MKILLSGSIAFDYLMTYPGYFKDHILPDHLESLSLSFLVDSMLRLRGGVAPNIAYTMALLGCTPQLWATVGEDFEEYRNLLESYGVDTKGARVIPGEFTASFFVNTDRSNAQIASFYPGAMAYARRMSLIELMKDPPDLVVISPNDPGAMKQYVNECLDMGIPYLYDPSQQIVRLSAEDVQKGLLGAQALFVNEYEFALIENLTGLGVEGILERNSGIIIVITRGKEGSIILTQNETIEIPIILAESVVDPTGVGDAFRGGFLTGFSYDLELKTCGRMGALAATYCLENSGPQGHHYRVEGFINRFREYFDDEGELDLLKYKY